MANGETKWNTERANKKSSFYGNHSKIGLEPTVLLGVPITDIYGQHLTFGKTKDSSDGK